MTTKNKTVLIRVVVALLVLAAVSVGGWMAMGRSSSLGASVNAYQAGVWWFGNGIYAGQNQEFSVSSAGALTTSGALTTTGALTVSGAASLASTLGVTATTTLNGNLIIGTSTPMSVTEDGFIAFDSGSGLATTTLYLASQHGTRGGCIQLETGASTTLHLYATTTGTPAIWQTGPCR